MAAHKSFTVASEVSIYFCDPKSPWQRGTSENTIRQVVWVKSNVTCYIRTYCSKC